MRWNLAISAGALLLAAQLIGRFSTPQAAAQTPSAVTALASPAGPGSEEPNLSVGPDGKLYMSWLEEAKPRGYAQIGRAHV